MCSIVRSVRRDVTTLVYVRLLCANGDAYERHPGLCPMHCCKILLDRARNVEEHPCHSLLPFSIDEEGIRVRILSCSMIDDVTGYSMIQIMDGTGTIKEGHYQYDGGESTVTKLSSNTYMAMVTNRKCMLSRLINHSGCFLSAAVPLSDTLIEWTLIGPDRARLQELFDRMRENGYSFEMIMSAPASEFLTLTPKQEEYFNTAMDLGYYDIPKRIDLDQLSCVLGCSKSTLNVSLRTAERNIFEFYRTMRFGSRLSTCDQE